MDIEILFEYVKQGFFTVEKHKRADLYIFGYATGPVARGVKKEWDDINKQMRGLIVDSKGVVHARSFEKFFTFREYLSDDIILTSDNQQLNIKDKHFRIFDKVDGTLSILYWVNDQPLLATQRSFTSLKAQRATQILQKKYSHLFSSLMRDRTYIFEAIYPEASVLIDYGDKEELVLIGILDNETGENLELEDIGFPIVEEVTDKYLDIKDLLGLEALNIENKEGFVLLFEDNKRIKVKFPWYQNIHMILDKILATESTLYCLERQLKEGMAFPKNIANTSSIWKRFKKGERPKEILHDFPAIYRLVGIEEWLNREFAKFQKASRSSTLIELVQPDYNSDIDISKYIHKPSSELVIWNRIKKLKERYD